jgi:hypothetical protein
LSERLHCSLIGRNESLHITLCLVDGSGRLNNGILHPGDRLDFAVALVLLLRVLLLNSDVGRLQGVLELLRQICLTQLQGLNARVALVQKDFGKLLLHIYLDLRDISEELTGHEVRRLIIHDIDSKPDARTLVVLAVLQVKFNEVG